MHHWEQFEVWKLNGDKWELASWFHELDVAGAVARSRRGGVRLIRATYEDGRVLKTETLADIGAIREKP
jgi:hypothetical protein